MKKIEKEKPIELWNLNASTNLGSVAGSKKKDMSDVDNPNRLTIEIQKEEKAVKIWKNFKKKSREIVIDVPIIIGMFGTAAKKLKTIQTTARRLRERREY